MLVNGVFRLTFDFYQIKNQSGPTFAKAKVEDNYMLELITFLKSTLD